VQRYCLEILSHNKCKQSNLGKLSPFSRCAAKKPTIYQTAVAGITTQEGTAHTVGRAVVVWDRIKLYQFFPCSGHGAP
jgi:hypothetical protein